MIANTKSTSLSYKSRYDGDACFASQSSFHSRKTPLNSYKTAYLKKPFLCGILLYHYILFLSIPFFKNFHKNL